MSRRNINAPFDAYLRSPDSPLSSMPQSASDHIPSGISPTSSMAYPHYNPAIKSANPAGYNYQYSSPYSAQLTSYNGLSPIVLDNVPDRSSSGPSSSHSAYSPHPHLDIPPLTVSSPYNFNDNGSAPNVASGSVPVSGLQFQMPSFLGAISTVAPGGGGEVINAPDVPFLPSFSVSGNGMSTVHRMSQYAGWAPNSDAGFDGANKAWLNKQTRQYTLTEGHQIPLTPSVALQATRKSSKPFDFAESGPPSSSSSSSVPPAPVFSQIEHGTVSDAHQPFDEPRTVRLDERTSMVQSNTLAPLMSAVSNAEASRVEENALNAIPLLDMPMPPTSTPAYDTQAILRQPNSSHFPLYSLSGFHILPVLARVCQRPNPRITLGPVDMSCAFVVADARQPDTPIVYASRTFCDLTGYAENEVIGRNCRFLQAPDGRVQRGDERKYTSPDAVGAMQRAVGPDAGPRGWKECQISLVNYRKGGQPFVNRVSIIPVPAEDSPPLPPNADDPHGWNSEIAFLIGFQVDLGVQPSRIAERLREGCYYPQYANMADGTTGKMLNPSERSAKSMRTELREWITDSKVQQALNLTTSCNASPYSKASPHVGSPSTSSARALPHQLPDRHDARQWLHLALLEQLPDFILALSLKGHFLYAAPAVKKVLGYDCSELLGRCVSDYCHPSDAVPLLRELKESTVMPTGLGIQGVTDSTSSTLDGPPAGNSTPETLKSLEQESTVGKARTVDLLFRMRCRKGNYIWIACLGRLHIEPGKGRKAIVLSGRACHIPNLDWNAISSSGGLAAPTNFMRQDNLEAAVSKKRKLGANQESLLGKAETEEREFWTVVCSDGLVLVASAGAKDVLGWGPVEMIGRSIREIFVDNAEEQHPPADIALYDVQDVLRTMKNTSVTDTSKDEMTAFKCLLRKRNGEVQRVDAVLFGPPAASSENDPGTQRFIMQFKLQPDAPDNHNPRAFIPLPRRPQARRSTSALGETDVFAELAPDRPSSWQYELQQLKVENRRIGQEVATLESKLLSPASQPGGSSSIVLNLDGTSSSHTGSDYNRAS